MVVKIARVYGNIFSVFLLLCVLLYGCCTDGCTLHLGVHRGNTDQWGVMHDGKLAYPGAVECIDRLAEAGKKIVGACRPYCREY